MHGEAKGEGDKSKGQVNRGCARERRGRRV